METDLAYCASCDRQVRIAWTPAPLHEGHANLPDGPEVVCLEIGDGCTGGTCPLTHLPSVVMGVRLARSGLREDPWPTARLRCRGCEETTEMEVVDPATLRCPVCGTINRWIVLELMERGYVAIEHPGSV